MEALAIFEANLCPDCGRPLDVCGDPDAAVMVDDRICMFTRAVEVARHWDESSHKKDKRARGVPFWSDGLSRIPRLMTDAEITEAMTRPLLPPVDLDAAVDDPT